MLSILCLLSLAAPAHAQDADTFELSSAIEAFPTTELDSGWWPEEGPVRVRTVLFAEGLAALEMAGSSVVDDSGSTTEQQLIPEADGGELELNLSIIASLYVSLDVAGYTYEDVIHQEDVVLDASDVFEPFAFASDGGAELSFPMDPVELFSVAQDVFPLVEVVVTADLSPTAEVDYQTTVISSEWGDFTAAGQAVSITDGGSTELSGSGSLASTLTLLIQGHAEVCITWVDCYGDFNFDFPLDPIDHTEDISFDTVTVTHAVIDTDGPDTADGDDAAATPKESGCATVSTRPDSRLTLTLIFLALISIGRRRDDG